jgi:DNA (cytosine-5)-methyltransferase 1
LPLAPGSGVKSPGKKETTRPGGHWGYKQGAFISDTNLAARTVTASAQQDWVKDEVLGLRRLAPRECAAIQTFPSKWEFSGKRTDQYRQIGNAVPPLLACAIANELKRHIDSDSVTSKKNVTHEKLNPLREELASAVHYTIKEEKRNGLSRRLAPPRRNTRILVLDKVSQE